MGRDIKIRKYGPKVYLVLDMSATVDGRFGHGCFGQGHFSQGCCNRFPIISHPIKTTMLKHNPFQ